MMLVVEIVFQRLDVLMQSDGVCGASRSSVTVP